MTKPRVKPLEWSDPQPPGATCIYNYVTTESAVGKYAIEWKSWKDHDWPGLFYEERYIDSFPTIEAAKAAAQADYEARILSALDMTPDPAVHALVEAARALQIDMLERAQMKIDAIHGEQYRIVNAGRSAWSDFCAALAAFDKTD